MSPNPSSKHGLFIILSSAAEHRQAEAEHHQAAAEEPGIHTSSEQQPQGKKNQAPIV